MAEGLAAGAVPAGRQFAGRTTSSAALTEYDAAGRAYRTIDNLGRDQRDRSTTTPGAPSAPSRTTTTARSRKPTPSCDVTVDYEYDSGGRLVTMTAYNAKGDRQRRPSRRRPSTSTTSDGQRLVADRAWSIPTAPTCSRRTGPPRSGPSRPTTATTFRPATTGWAAPRARPTSGAWCTTTPSTRPAGSRPTRATEPRLLGHRR